MPYAMENRAGQIVVVNKATGAVKGRHATRAKAVAQLDKLHMIERKSGDGPPKRHRSPPAIPGGGSDGKQNPFEAAMRQPDAAQADSVDDPAGDEADAGDMAGDDPVEQALERADEAAALRSETKSRRRHRFGG